MTLRAPFPWFGGKSRVAHLVWEAFGDVPNYVEPFAGSLAVLLGRPSSPRIETVNDVDCYLSNFWRAVQHAPDMVAKHADYPVCEVDLHARHQWLVDQVEFRERMKTEPTFYDPLVAGWWVWGICQWIGGGWCTDPQWRGRGNAAAAPRGIQTAMARRPPRKKPSLSHTGPGVGVHSGRRPALKHDQGINQKRPHLANGGRGVKRQLPDLSGDSGAAGRGVHASARAEGAIYDWMQALAERLRRVRVCCGDWRRVLGPAVTTCIGVTGVFLDPPYGDTADRDPSIYACDDLEVAHQVREWAIENGSNPRLRIALCGYEGEHRMPADWTCVAWKANGGYGSRNPDNDNAKRERIWFSPHCLGARQRDLFTSVGAVP